MKLETAAIHAGYETDPATKAVAQLSSIWKSRAIFTPALETLPTLFWKGVLPHSKVESMLSV
jgi:hypothetical protein